MLSLSQLVFRYFLPKMAWMTRRPIFWYKPLLEVGMPVLRAKLRLAAVTPKSVFQLNPPRFTMHSSNPVCLWALISPKVFVFCFIKHTRVASLGCCAECLELEPKPHIHAASFHEDAVFCIFRFRYRPSDEVAEHGGYVLAVYEGSEISLLVSVSFIVIDQAINRQGEAGFGMLQLINGSIKDLFKASPPALAVGLLT